MNSRYKLNKPLLMLGVLMLFGLSALLPGTKSAQSTASRLQAGFEKGEFVRSLMSDEPEEMENSEAEQREARPDQPDEAIRFRRLQMKDEKGVIPSNGLEKARQHTRQMRVAPSSTIKPDSWEWLGPGNIGGRTRTLVFDPTDPSTIWLGSVGGGIWRSVDGGTSWGTLTDFIANLAVSTMVINPTNSDMYAGTGEIFASNTSDPGNGFSPDGLLGAGVFKSTDKGLTWNQLPRTNPTVCPAPATPINCPWLYVNRLAISPDGSTLLAATGRNIERSTDGDTTWVQGPEGLPGRFSILILIPPTASKR